MSSFDAAPLPRLGQVFFDVRGSSRSMRVSWYGDTGVAVFSIWQGGRCTGTFRLPVDDLARMVDTLRDGPDGEPAGPDGPDAGRGYPGQDFREPDFREQDFREPDFRDAGFRDSGPGTPPLPDLPPGPPGPDLMGSGRRPAGRPAAGHTVEVDPADPLGLGYSDDAAAGYRDGGFPAASDPYGPYSSADTGPRYPAEPAYPADLAYGPPEGGYPGDREPDYPGASHGDYPRGDSAYPAGDPGYLPGGGPGDYAGGGAPDYLSGSPRRPSADHAPPYDSWPGPDSGAHSDPQGWDRDYPDSGDGDYGYAPPGSGSARHSR